MSEMPRKPLPFILYVLRPFRRHVLWFLGLSFLGIVSWTVAPFLIRNLLNELADTKELNSYVWLMAGLFILARFLDEWFWRIAENVGRKFGPDFIESVRYKLFSETLKKPYEFFVNNSSGQLGHWINQTASTVEEVFNTTVWSVWPRVFTLLLSGALLWIVNWALSLIFIFWVVGLGIYVTRRGRRYTQLVDTEADAKSKASGQVVDALSNHISVRVFGSRQFELDQLSKTQNVIIKRWRRSWGFGLVTNIVKGNSAAVVSGVSLALMLVLFSHGKVQIGDVALFITYMTDASSSIWELGWQLDSYYRSFGQMQNALNGLLESDEERGGEHLPAAPARAGIRFDNMSFAYPDQEDKPVLKGLDVDIKPGERVGIVGHSGAGKSTLVSLILGFYPPSKGTIVVAGKDIAELDPKYLRRLIAFVPQDTNLFNRTVKDNIRYANPDASETQIIQASRDAQAYEFISDLNKGMDTLIGERGVKLSGGQRQRVAIARALLKDAPILLLDEATSALDSQSEQAIQKALVTAMKGRTALVIAHRLSTLKHLDRILVFEKGRIVQDGTHDSLIAAQGIYADLWQRQRDGFLGE